MNVKTTTTLLEKAAGFEGSHIYEGTRSFEDLSTIILCPTRGMIDFRVVNSWENLIKPPNQKVAKIYGAYMEVGDCYNGMVAEVLNHPELSKWKFILTVEDDNILPVDALVKLYKHTKTYDAVSGLYWTKTTPGMPMAYGDPKVYEETGELNFIPRSVEDPIRKGEVIEVNGIAMGCALWKMELFRDIEQPWFKTQCEAVENSAKVATQDLYFCSKARKAGKRFAVDCSVKIGHLDTASGVVY